MTCLDEKIEIDKF